MRSGFQPTLGAVVHPSGGTSFGVWAPTTTDVTLVYERPDGEAGTRRLRPGGDGMFTATFDDLGAGVRYGFRLDGEGPFPDPASRYQPDGVHGLSMVVDPGAYAWSDDHWTGVRRSALVVYELHVGTFSDLGTFSRATALLVHLRGLGITAVELMPVADFPGGRNWGYDGAALFAPARCYGRPDDLRRLIDTAHGLGLAVLIDVVYNHTGPDGAYLARFSPLFFTDRHRSPWGAGINLDGEGSAQVREFFIENALHWIHEYHADGLRLDATHALADDSPRHFLAELAARVHGSVPTREVHVIAEDHRNLAVMVEPRERGGWGLDAVWADDLHHQFRRLLAGDSDGYYRDFTGTTADLATTLRQGWFFTGQHSIHLDGPRGTDPSSLEPSRFVVCLQNHDQIGNRAFGERLHHQVDLAAFRAASVVLCLAPQIPLIFMGQEWAAASPFLYFTDHGEPLGRMVTEGRRREFGTFAAFADEAARGAIPDPQAMTTFAASRLDWSERGREPHASVLRLYSAALTLRAQALVPDDAAADARALDPDTIVMLRTGRDGVPILVVARLRGQGVVDVSDLGLQAPAASWSCLLTSEDRAFSPKPSPPVFHGANESVRFTGPAAVVLRAGPPPADR